MVPLDRALVISYRLSMVTMSLSAAVCRFGRNLQCKVSVCLSFVCHIRALCLNRSTDLDAIWQVHLWGPVTHCVRWDP